MNRKNYAAVESEGEDPKDKTNFYALNKKQKNQDRKLKELVKMQSTSSEAEDLDYESRGTKGNSKSEHDKIKALLKRKQNQSTN